MLYFLKKTAKFAAALEAPPPNPLASGGWGFAPRTPVVIPITCCTYFLKAFVALTSLLSKKNENNLEIAIIFSFCPSFLFLTLRRVP